MSFKNYINSQDFYRQTTEKVCIHNNKGEVYVVRENHVLQ